MIKKGLFGALALVGVFVGGAIYALGAVSSPNRFDAPERTQWAPNGPRSMPYIGDATDLAGGDVLGNDFRVCKNSSQNST